MKSLKKWYKMKLLNQDANVVLDHMIQNDIKVDTIISDIPYGTTQQNWDKTIPFDIIDKCFKISNTFITTVNIQALTELMKRYGKWFREELVWIKNKSGSGMHSKHKHMKVHEYIVVFSKKQNTYNPQKWLVEKKEFLTQRKTLGIVTINNNVYATNTRVKHLKKDNGTRNPLSVVSARVPFTPSKSKTYSKEVDLRMHPNQKPLKLYEYLIKTYTNENDVVFDPFMGSGTTGVACKELNRKFLGVELDKEYFDIAKRRIHNEKI